MIIRFFFSLVLVLVLYLQCWSDYREDSITRWTLAAASAVICSLLSNKSVFPISRSLSTSRRRTDELGYRLERPIHFECKLNEPMHIGMRLLHPAAADHSVSINRQQVQRIFSFSLRSRAVTSFCSWLLLNEWIQRVEHALRKTLVLVVRHYSGGGSSHVEWTAHIRLHYPLFVLQMTISPVCFSMLK